MKTNLPEPCLVLDGANRHGTAVGIYQNGRWLAQVAVSEGAMEATAGLVERILLQANCKLADIASFAVCEGPGSILGIRVTAMMARTWATQFSRPLYVWSALDLTAQIAQESQVALPFLVISESRLKKWNVLKVVDDKSVPVLAEGTAEEILSLGLPLISASPASVDVFPSVKVLATGWEVLPRYLALLARENAKPEALNPTNDFALWSGERHRGPV